MAPIIGKRNADIKPDTDAMMEMSELGRNPYTKYYEVLAIIMIMIKLMLVQYQILVRALSLTKILTCLSFVDATNMSFSQGDE